MKVGLLVSKSLIYPEISFDFMNGLRLAIGNDNNIEFVIESIDFGAKESIIVEKAQKILFEQQLHCIIALGGQLLTKTLSGVASASHVPVIIADTGGDMYTENNNPWVFLNSTALWKDSFLMGNLIQEKEHKNIGVISSFYDSGYKMIHAFTEALEITPAFTYITAYDAVPQEAEELTNQIITHRPDAIFVVLSHEYASRFLTYYKSINSEEPCTLYATSTFSSEAILEEAASDISITTITSWSAELDKKENKSFASTYLERFYKEASIFSVLGYECGKALSLSIETLSAENPSPKMLADALRNVNFEGPRSTFNFKGNLQHHEPKHWLVEVNYKDKKYTTEIIKEINVASEKETALLDKTKVLQDAGWSNPYLCI